MVLLLSFLAAGLLAFWLEEPAGFYGRLTRRQAWCVVGELLFPPRQTMLAAGRYTSVDGQFRRVGVLRSAVQDAGTQRRRIEERWRSRGGTTQLPPLAGATVNVFKQTKNKLWSEKENWSLKKVPAATEEVEIEAGKECELITTAGKCLSFTMPSTAKFVGSAALEVGGSTEPRAGGVAKRAVSIASGAVVSWTGKLELVSTYKTGELGVLIVPELKGAFQIKVESATATYILEEALLSSSSVGLKNTTEGGLNTNSKKVTCSEFSVANKAAVSLGKSELLDLSSWTWSSEGKLTAGESLIRVEGGTFTGGAQTYNNVTLKGAGIEVKAVGTGEGTDTFNVLKLETKGLAATKVHEGVTLVVTTLECNGTEAEPCIIESAVAGQKWKIKAATNQTVKYLKVKDSKAETSTFTTEGNGAEGEWLTRTEGWAFKAVGGGKKTYEEAGKLAATGKLTGTAKAVALASGNLAATGKLTGSGNAIAVLAGKIAAVGRLTVTAVKQTIATATLAAVGRLAGQGIKQTASAATISGTGKLTGTGVKQVTATGTLSTVGRLTASRVIVVSSTGQLSSTGSLSSSSRVLARTTSTLSGVARLKGYTGSQIYEATARLAATGRLTATGRASAVAAGRITASSNITGAGVRVTPAGATLAATPRLTGTGKAIGVSSGVMKATGTIKTSSRVLAAASGLLKAIGRLLGFTSKPIAPETPTLYTGIGVSLVCTSGALSTPVAHTDCVEALAGASGALDTRAVWSGAGDELVTISDKGEA